MGVMDSIANLSTAQKIMAAGALAGGGYLLLRSTGGAAAGGAAEDYVGIVDVRRPTDDMNVPGSEWGGGDAYQSMQAMNREWTQLFGRLVPNGQGGITSPVVPPVIAPPVDPVRGNPMDRFVLNRLKQATRINTNFIGDIQDQPGGLTDNERERIDRLRGRNSGLLERIELMRNPAPMPNPGTPGPPTPTPGPDEVVR